MDALKPIDPATLMLVKMNRPYLTAQQYRTLRGQVLAGDAEGARKGLRKIILLAGSNAVRMPKRRR